MLRYLRYLVEVIAAFVGVSVVLCLLLAWRISSAPVTSDFLTPYIESGIESIIPNSKVSMGATLLTWSRSDLAISVHAENIKVSDVAGAEIADIPSFDTQISVLGLVFGQFMPKELAVDHPQIKLSRTKDGLFFFGGMQMGKASQQGQQAAASSGSITDVMRAISENLSGSALMHRLAITRAVFDIHDENTQKDWSVSIPEISITRSLFGSLSSGFESGALDGRMTVEITQIDGVASMDVRYTYNPSSRQHDVSAVFVDVTPAFIAGGHPETLGIAQASMIDLPLSGKIKASLSKDMTVTNVSAQIHGDAGHLVSADMWDAPCPVKSFDLGADYDRAAHKLSVKDTRVDFDGPTLDLKVDGVASALPGQDMDFTALLKVESLPMNRYAEIWPKTVLPDPRSWLTANLRNGVFAHADVTLRGSLAFNDLANLSVVDGGGRVVATNGRVTYVEGMPAVEGVNADATFDLKKMDVKITGGGLGNIRLSPFTVQITGLADADQYIDVPLQVAGPVPEILRLLDHPPLGYAKALGLGPDDMAGAIEGSVFFHFPLLKSLAMKDVTIKANAKATNVASTKLIPGLAIDQGNLALELDTSGFNFKGQASLDKIPFQVAWQENFDLIPGKPLRKATVNGVIKDDQWSNFGISAFKGTKGPVNVSLEMTKPAKNKMVLTGALDMGAAALNVDMLAWKKPANVPSVLKFTANAVNGKPVVISNISLRGPQATASGEAVLSSDMSQLQSLSLSSLVMGRTNAAIRFTQSAGERGALRFDASGVSLDVGGLRGGNDPDKADPRPKEYHIQVERLYTGDTGLIAKAQGHAARDQEGWREINLKGLADGDTPISITLLPQPDGHRVFDISSESFGKAMKGLGFTDTIKGGKLSISGQSTVATPRLITGTAKIGDFTIEKLPVLALLMNATSPFGLTGILTDSASFSRFEGDFNWQGDAFTLTRAHAAGSAIGINVDGSVDMNSGDANLQGTLVPFSVMNNLLNYIPVLGGLITGGQDQGVLAVAYRINGSLGSPKISVNPVSLLTPGFIRNLFFRDDLADNAKPTEGK